MNIFIYVILGLLVALILTIIGLRIYQSIKLKGLQSTIVELIVKAENAFEHGMNDEKFNFVFEKIYSLFPDFIKTFISVDDIKAFIQQIFSEIKVALDNVPKIENKK